MVAHTAAWFGAAAKVHNVGQLAGRHDDRQNNLMETLDVLKVSIVLPVPNSAHGSTTTYFRKSLRFV
jgi:hypothetical protein